MTPKPEPLREKNARYFDIARLRQVINLLADYVHAGGGDEDDIEIVACARQSLDRLSTLPASQGGVEEEQDLSVSQDQGQGPCADAVPQPAPSPWRPIETAPKDGTRVLLWIVHANAKFSTSPVKDGWAAACIGSWIDHNGGGWSWEGLAGERTHWQPLPPPPDFQPPARSETGEARKPGHGWTLSPEAAAEIDEAQRANTANAAKAFNIVFGSTPSPVTELVSAADRARDHFQIWMESYPDDITTETLAAMHRLSKALEAFKSETA